MLHGAGVFSSEILRPALMNKWSYHFEGDICGHLYTKNLDIKKEHFPFVQAQNPDNAQLLFIQDTIPGCNPQGTFFSRLLECIKFSPVIGLFITSKA